MKILYLNLLEIRYLKDIQITTLEIGGLKSTIVKKARPWQPMWLKSEYFYIITYTICRYTKRNRGIAYTAISIPHILIKIFDK